MFRTLIAIVLYLTSSHLWAQADKVTVTPSLPVERTSVILTVTSRSLIALHICISDLTVYDEEQEFDPAKRTACRPLTEDTLRFHIVPKRRNNPLNLSVGVGNDNAQNFQMSVWYFDYQVDDQGRISEPGKPAHDEQAI